MRWWTWSHTCWHRAAMGVLESWRVSVHPLLRGTSQHWCPHLQSPVSAGARTQCRNMDLVADASAPIRSVTLDTWQSHWVETFQQWGNARAAALWEYHLPEDFRRPVGDDQAMTSFIRNKYQYRR